MPVDLASVSLDQVALLNQRSGFILMGAVDGSRPQAEEWDSWLESYRTDSSAVAATLRSHRIVDHVVVKVLTFSASWWELADGPMRFASTFGEMASYLIPRDGLPMPDITAFAPPNPTRGSAAMLAAHVDGILDRPDQELGDLRTWCEEAEAARSDGDLARADTALARAAEILAGIDGPSTRDNVDETLRFAVIAARLGDSMHEKDLADRALSWWHAALTIIGALAPQSAPVANLSRKLGALCRARGDLDAALKFFQRALSIEVNTEPLTALAFIDISLVAVTHQQRKEFDEARQLLATGIELSDAAPAGHDARARLLHTAGDVERDSGDRDAARAFYERALSIAEPSDPFSEDTVALLIKLGELESECGRTDSALQLLERALPLAQTTDPTSLATVSALLAIARVHLNRGAPEQALAYKRRASEIIDNTGLR